MNDTKRARLTAEQLAGQHALMRNGFYDFAAAELEYEFKCKITVEVERNIEANTDTATYLVKLPSGQVVPLSEEAQFTPEGILMPSEDIFAQLVLIAEKR